ncbi:MAG: MFS transporter [Pseudomonadota bacterium]
MSDATTADMHGDTAGPDDARARRNAVILSISQALYGINAITVFALASILGNQFADDKSLATLPVTTMVLGAALATAPGALGMHRFGRRSGFLFGAGLGLIGMLAMVYATYIQSFWWLCIGSSLNGVYMAFGQHYRFAAADTATEAYKPKVISWVLFGGIAGAILGPQLILSTQNIFAPVFYAGAFAACALITLAAIILLLFLDIPRPRSKPFGPGSGRPLVEILRQRPLCAAIAAGMVSYGMMNLVMTAAPLAMVVFCGHTVDDATGVIRWHVLAMYAPSFFTGHLIARFGRDRVIIAGLALLVACATTALLGITVAHFTAGLILLGLGWNLAFIGATTKVTDFHTPQERGKVQAFNDFMVFGFVAFASFMSGKLLFATGWDGVNLTIFPFVALTVFLVLVLSRTRVAKA